MQPAQGKLEIGRMPANQVVVGKVGREGGSNVEATLVMLQGLGGLQRHVKSHPVRRAVFGVVAFLSSPFVMVGGLFLAFGNDVDDHVFGLVLLVLLLPGLVALWRWAWPRR